MRCSRFLWGCQIRITQALARTLWRSNSFSEAKCASSTTPTLSMQGSKGNRLERWDLSDVGHKNAQKPTWQSGKCMNMWFYHVLSCLGLCNSTIFYTLISLTSGIVICGSVWLGHTRAFSLAELERRRWRGRERERERERSGKNAPGDVC